MISLDKLTVKSQEALQDAVRLASERGHAEVETEHLLCAFLRQEGGVMGSSSPARGLPATAALRGGGAACGPAEGVRGGHPGTVPPPRAAVPARLAEADAFKDEFLSAEHFLLASRPSPGRWPTSCGNSG